MKNVDMEIAERLSQMLMSSDDKEFLDILKQYEEYRKHEEAKKKEMWQHVFDILKVVMTCFTNVFMLLLVLGFEHFVPVTSKLFGWIRPMTC